MIRPIDCKTATSRETADAELISFGLGSIAGSSRRESALEVGWVYSIADGAKLVRYQAFWEFSGQLSKSAVKHLPQPQRAWALLGGPITIWREEHFKKIIEIIIKFILPSKQEKGE